MIPMKHVLLALTLAVSGSAIQAQQISAPAAEAAPAFKAHVLSRTEFDDLLKHPDKILVIDVRRPDEVTAIGGFPVYLSIQPNDLESKSAWIPKNRRIITVSNHAARAGKAADLLKAKGFNVAGAVGAQLYEKDGGTLIKLTPPAKATPANAGGQ
jgi:rhodanese-related sulfurtransferase